jgi:O-antigen ligase
MMERVKPASGFFFVMKYFEYFIVYFMAVNHLKEKKQVERFILTILIVCFIVCMIGMFQIPSGVRVSAPFEGSEGEPNTLGGYLDLLLALTIGLLLTNGLPKYRYFLLLLVPTMAIVLAATLSRSSWLALIPMVIFLLYFSKRKLLMLVPLLLVMIFAPFIMPKAVSERALYTFTQRPESGQMQIGNVRIDTSTSARLQTWKKIVKEDWIKFPVLGYGITGYTFVDAQYPRVLVETGVIGFIAFAVLMSAIFINALSVYKNTTDPLFSGISLGYLAGFAVLLTHGIGANTFIIVRIMEPFWFLTAIVIMIKQIESGEVRKEDQQIIKGSGLRKMHTGKVA